MATANTAIKITSLPNIGNNIAPSTLIPVVNMAGAPVTQKANLQITGNLILAGAGTANFVPAGLANLAYSVVNAAQPNITSTGTLNVNTLKVSGGVNGQYLQTDGTGNLAWVSGSSSGNGEVGGSNTQIQFNDAGNFGGNTGFTFVKTTGILAAPFADVSGVANIVGGGATVATKSVLNVASTFGSNSSAEPASAQAIRGRVTGANLTKTRNYVTGVTGQYLVTGTNASEFIKAGVLGVVGDQTTTADGAVVAYLDGDGGLTTANAAYAVSMKNSTPNSGFNYGLDLQFINLNLGGVTTSTFKQADIRFNNGVTLVANTAGNISINGNLMTSAEVVASGAIESGTGLTTGGYLSVDGNTDLHNTIVTGNLSATGNITANNLGNISAINLTGSNSNVLYGNGVFAAVTGGGNTGNVTFNDINIIGDGNLHLQPDSTNAASYLDIFLTSGPDLHLVASAAANLILGKDDGPNVMTSWDGNVYVQSWNLDTGNVGGIWTFNGGGSIDIPAESNSFDEGRIQSANGYPTLLAYGSGSHGGPELDCMDGDDPNDMGNAGVLRNTLYLNNDDGLYVGMNENNVANTFTGSWRFTPQGTTIFPTLEVDLHNGGVQTGQVLQFGNSSQQAIITGPTPEANVNAQRLIIQGQRGNGTGEGGDVYLWAGDADINGGDIKIYAGDADNASAGGGGYINLAGGDGFNYGGDITLNGGYGTNGYGGQISINGGTGQTDGGPAYINGGQASGNGGAVSITAGYGGANGGQVVISGGQSALGLSHYGNVVVSAGASAWTFDWNGNLTVPQNIHGSGALQLQGLANGNTTINIGSGVGGDIDMVSNLGNINLYTASNQPWIFDQGGNFTAPGAINVGNMSIGTVPGDITANNNTTVAFNVTGSDGGFLVNYLDEVGNANTSGGELAFNSELGNATYRISLSDDLGDGFATKIWRFDGTGNLTLPTNAFTVNYANGTQVSLGGAGNTGNVTFDNVTVQGVNGLNLSAGADFTANLAYLQVRAGDVASHIHLDTGNNSAYDLIVGDDQNYVQVSSTGNIILSSYDSNTDQYTWTFDYNGNFILAKGSGVIQSVNNSSLDPVNPNVSTMVLTPHGVLGSQSLVLDPTAPGHIHLRTPSYSSNIDEPVANIFLGGEDSSFEVGYYNGSAPNVFVHSGGNTWTFGNDGTTTFPTGNITSNTSLQFTTTFANVNTVEYQTAGVWDVYVEDTTTGPNDAWSWINVTFKDNLINKPEVFIENQKANDGIAQRWTFDENGILNFPRDVAGNTDPYLSIEGGATPTIQSTDVSLAGPANLAIQSDYLNLSGFSGDKIVFYADDGLIATDYDMVLTTNVGGGNTYTWTLDATGNLNLPGNLVIAGNTNVFGTDSALIQPSNNLPLLSISSGANGAVSSVWVEDIGNVGTSNIASVYANPIPGSGIVRIAVGQNGGPGPNLWDFGTDGNLTIPGGGAVWTLGAGTSGLTANFADPYKVNLGLDYTTNTATLAGANGVVIQSNTGANSNQWTFSADGGLYSPEGSSLGGSLAPNEFALFNNVDTNFSIYTSAANVMQQWTFSADGNLTLPEGGAITNNIPPVTFDILYQYDDLEWDGITVTFTNASSTYMLGVLALMQAGDPITLVGPGGPISTTVSIPYTGGSAGYFTVTEATSPIQITQFTLPNRLTSVNGVTLTTNAKNYLFTEAGVTQSPVLTVDTLPSGVYAVAGFRAFVSDANLAPVGNFGEIVGNSGSNTVCVWCDGTNWRIG